MAEEERPTRTAHIDDAEYVSRRIKSMVLLGIGLAAGFALLSFGGCSLAWCLRGTKPAICEALWENPPWILISGIAAAPSVVLTWYWRSANARNDLRNKTKELEHKAKELAREGQRLSSTRFVDAVKLLAEETDIARLGAIYSLEHIAKDSPNDHARVLETLAAFVRSEADWPAAAQLGAPREAFEDNEPSPKMLVQAAMTVIGRLGPAESLMGRTSADLRGVYLQGIDLEQANLAYSRLDHANLNDAHLRGANLRCAVLFRTRLVDARLDESHLDDAMLSWAELRNASVRDADLSGAKLAGADFTGAQLSGTVIENAQIGASSVGPDGSPLREWLQAYSPVAGKVPSYVLPRGRSASGDPSP